MVTLRIRTAKVVLSCLALMVMSGSTARATVVFGNLGSTGADGLSNTNTDITAAQRLAQGFSTGSATDRVLQSITLGLFFDSSTTSPFSLSIYNDNNGLPGSAVATSSSVSVGNTGKYTFPFSNFTLQPATAYWVVPPQDLSWYRQFDEEPPTAQNGSGYAYVNAARSLDSGATWAVRSQEVGLSISVVAVPEPTTVGLVAAAGFAGGVTVLRRRRG